MTIASPTPGGPRDRCSICGERRVIASGRKNDGLCTRCRQLFEWLSATRFDPSECTLSSNIREIGFESLDFVELIMEIEEEFGIRIPDDEAVQITTVGDMIRAISRQERGDYE